MHRAFTLIELLVVITIIAVLAALMVPAVSMIRNGANRTATQHLVLAINTALEDYRPSDYKRRYPPAQANDLIDYADEQSPISSLGNLLVAQAGLRLESRQLDAGRIIDGWRRPIRYRVDAVVDGTAAPPAPRVDWNPRAKEPYAYVWSLGQIRQGDADGDAGNAKNWIIVSEAP